MLNFEVFKYVTNSLVLVTLVFLKPCLAQNFMRHRLTALAPHPILQSYHDFGVATGADGKKRNYETALEKSERRRL
jgi:hypothetical protein